MTTPALNEAGIEAAPYYDNDSLLLKRMLSSFESSFVGQQITDDMKRELRAANRLIATLSASKEPGQEPVAVKALEWTGPHLSMWVSEPMPGFQYRIIYDGRGHDTFNWFVGGVWKPATSFEAAKAAAHADYEARIRSSLIPAKVAPQEAVALGYTNWRGEFAVRKIIPQSIWFGATEWHPEPQWLLKAIDVEKNAERDFALTGFATPIPAKADALVVTDAMVEALKLGVAYDDLLLRFKGPTVIFDGDVKEIDEAYDKWVAATRAAVAALEASTGGAETGTVLPECASDGCGKPATVRFERGGIGSEYCHDCSMRIQAIPAAPVGERKC
jgi:hypothetical protein